MKAKVFIYQRLNGDTVIDNTCLSDKELYAIGMVRAGAAYVEYDKLSQEQINNAYEGLGLATGQLEPSNKAMYLAG